MISGTLKGLNQRRIDIWQNMRISLENNVGIKSPLQWIITTLHLIDTNNAMNGENIWLVKDELVEFEI